MKTYILISTLFFTILTTQGNTQIKLIYTEKNNSETNSPNNYVRSYNGYTYKGSKNGIKMWDQYAYIDISTDNSNIPENNVTALYMDGDNLWIGTNSSGIVIGFGYPIKPFRTRILVTHEKKIYSITNSQGCVLITYQSGGVECFRNEISVAYYPKK